RRSWNASKRPASLRRLLQGRFPESFQNKEPVQRRISALSSEFFPHVYCHLRTNRMLRRCRAHAGRVRREPLDTANTRRVNTACFDSDISSLSARAWNVRQTQRQVKHMRMLRKHALALALAASFVAPLASAGTPYPTRETPKAVDLGAPAGAHTASITVTVALKLRNADQMSSVMQSLYTQGSPQFHHFLSTAEFQARFAPSRETVKRTMAQFEAKGLKVTQISSGLLSVTGSQAVIEKAFSVSLHTFEVPAQGRNGAYRFHAP